MNKLLLLLLCAFTLTCACNGNTSKTSSKNEYTTDEDKVYICTGGSSKRYHATDNCRGLGNCSGEIIDITIDEAEGLGRTPCKICY